MIGPEAFWAVTVSLVAYSIIGPERFLVMWNKIKTPIVRFWRLGEDE